MLCLGSVGMDCVISELSPKGTILQRNYRKMTISYNNSFVKVQIIKKKNSEPQHDCIISKISVISRDRTALYNYNDSLLISRYIWDIIVVSKMHSNDAILFFL